MKIKKTSQKKETSENFFDGNTISLLYKRNTVNILFFVTILLLTIYSYTLIDLNLTLINSPLWNIFRSAIIQIGYFKREISWIIYFSFISSLFIFHSYFSKNYKRINTFEFAFIVSSLLVLSYPFLSHDFFNYMFDAKIATFYHQNPYLFKPSDFPDDHWLRFMHWTHRTYPYGPTFLVLSFIPAFLSAGKLFLSYIFFKLFFIVAYFTSIFFLSKIDKKKAIFFATHPLVLIEGAISSHNDLIAVALGIVGIYYYLQNNKTKAFLYTILSGGIKFITLPLILIPSLLFKSFHAYDLKRFSLIGVLIAVIYISISGEIQPWYFLNLLVFIPFFSSQINDFSLFFYGLLLSYYPFIRLGAWDSPDKINLKHQIIIWFLIINVFYLIIRQFYPDLSQRLKNKFLSK